MQIMFQKFEIVGLLLFSALTGVGGSSELHLFTAKGSEYNTANLLSKKVAGSRVPIMPILLRAVYTTIGQV